MADRIIDDVTLRAYFASVIGPFRRPFGVRGFVKYPAADVTTQRLVLNSTRDRVLAVTVSRQDVTGAANPVTFSQQVNGASSNDFSVTFTGVGIFNFIVRPGESLTLQSSGAAAMNVVVQQETY